MDWDELYNHEEMTSPEETCVHESEVTLREDTISQLEETLSQLIQESCANIPGLNW